MDDYVKQIRDILFDDPDEFFTTKFYRIYQVMRGRPDGDWEPIWGLFDEFIAQRR